MDASSIQLLPALGQALLVFALAFAAVVLLTSHLRFQAMARAALAAEDTVGGEGKAFQVQVAHRLGTAHRDPTPFSLVLIQPRDAAALAERHGAALLAEYLDLLEARLRRTIRSSDSLLRYGEDKLAMLVEARLDAVPLVLAHIQEEVRREPFRTRNETLLRADLLMAVAGFPQDGDKAHPLHQSVRAALDRAVAGEPTPVFFSPPQARAEEPPPEQKGLVDELTGVLREDRMGTAMQKFVARFRKEDLPVSMICLDVDNLRRYNEQYGRKAGDIILRQLADFLQKALRESDLIARFGGDQFLVALPCAAGEALAVAQRLAQGAKRLSFPVAGANLKLSVCAGVAGAPEHGLTARHLFDAASEALRTAKARGRGSSMVYDDRMQRPAEAQERSDTF